MLETHNCPQCGSTKTMSVPDSIRYLCYDCKYEFANDKPVSPMRIFLSYGHDSNEELVLRIKTDLEKRNHDVWLDKSEIRFGDEWRHSITDGILKSDRVLSFLSKHSTRNPGVCLDEIAIAIGVKGGNVQTILVESEQEVQPPVNIGHIQWLDMHDWKERFSGNEAAWEPWYQARLAEIIRVVESDESRRFAGEIETLNDHLKPIKSEARTYQLLSKGFYGREWLFSAVENWRQDKNHDSRLFWIMGTPGVGKSAFTAQLTHMRGDTVIAAQFCEWDKPDHRNAQRVVRSLAFQIGTRLPDYRKLLLTLPEINDLDQKNPDELFDYLLAGPLRHAIDGGRERYLIVIDALDEAVEAGRNPLVEMLARNAQRLPDWISFVVTSRPEKNVMAPLQGLKPFVLDTGTEANRDDIRNYLSHELAPKLKDRPDASRLIEQILEKSEGVFLYVERLCDEIQHGHISLDHPDQFPQGIGGIFIQYFQRQFPNSSEYKASIRPILESICAQREPLPLSILAASVNLSDNQLRERLAELGSLFPIRKGSSNTEDTVTSFHKSIIDWLTEKDELTGYFKAGSYVVDIETGRKRLTDACWAQYQQSPYKMSVYALHYLPYHLTSTGMWKDLEKILVDFGFMEAKLQALGVYSLIEDYNLVHILSVVEKLKLSEKSLRLIQNALQLSAHILRNKEQLRSQLIGRLLSFQEPEIRSLLDEASQCKSEMWLRPLIPSLTPPGGPLILTMKGHTGRIWAVSLTPDGRRAISASEDNTLKVWDMETGAEVTTMKGHTGRVRAVSVTPDGRYAISASADETLKVWDIETGAE
ncbi:MAG: TIR domain-containing protein, partial [Methanothrix sp.]